MPKLSAPMYPLLIILSFMSIVWLSSCGKDAGNTPMDEDYHGYTASDIQDFQTVMASLEEAVPTRLDLSVEVQYRFLVRQMYLAGFTPDNSPQLFHAISSSRQSSPPGNGLTESPSVSISYLGTLDGVKYTAIGEVDFTEEARTVNLSLLIIDGLTGQFIAHASDANQDFSGKMTLTAAGSFHQSLVGQTVRAMMTYAYQTQAGIPVSGTITSTYTYRP